MAVTDKALALIVVGRDASVTHDATFKGISPIAAAAVDAPHTTYGDTELAPAQALVVATVLHDVTIVGNDAKPFTGFVLVYTQLLEQPITVPLAAAVVGSQQAAPFASFLLIKVLRIMAIKTRAFLAYIF